MKVKLEDGSIIDVDVNDVTMTDEEKASLVSGGDSSGEGVFSVEELAQQLKDTKEKLSVVEGKLDNATNSVEDLKKEFSKMYFNGVGGEGEGDGEGDGDDTNYDEIIDNLKGEF